jgi:hypothetical protein
MQSLLRGQWLLLWLTTFTDFVAAGSLLSQIRHTRTFSPRGEQSRPSCGLNRAHSIVAIPRTDRRAIPQASVREDLGPSAARTLGLALDDIAGSPSVCRAIHSINWLQFP